MALWIVCKRQTRLLIRTHPFCSLPPLVSTRRHLDAVNNCTLGAFSRVASPSGTLLTASELFLKPFKRAIRQIYRSCTLHFTALIAGCHSWTRILTNIPAKYEEHVEERSRERERERERLLSRTRSGASRSEKIQTYARNSTRNLKP